MRARLAGGIAWTLAGSLLQQASLLASSILVARVAGKIQFGEFVLLQGTLGTFALLASGAFAMTATRHVAALRLNDPLRTASLCRLLVVSTAVISLAFSCALALFAGYLATYTLRDSSLATALRWGALYLFFQSYQGVQSGILCGIEAFSQNAQASALRAAILIAFMFVLAPRFGVTGAVFALVISAFGASIHLQVLLRKELTRHGIPSTAPMEWSDLRTLWNFSVPAFLSSALVPPVLWIANVLLARQPDGYAEVAIFGAASQWRAVVAFLPAVLAQPLLPLLTAALLSGKRATFRRLALAGVLLNTTSAAAVALVIVAGAPLIATFYGKGFAQSVPVLMELSVATVIGAAASAIGYVLASVDDMWAGVLLNGIWAATFLAILYSRASHLGAPTVARAFLVAYGVHAVTTTVYTLYRLHRVVAKPGLN